MKIWLKQAIFVNRAPFENLVVEFEENGISVLSAVNGRGKTTLISHIVDAFHEIARPAFLQEFEGDKENQYYRLSSAMHSIDRAKPSIVYLRFGTREITSTGSAQDAQIDDGVLDYIDVRGKLSGEEYDRLIPVAGKIEFAKFKGEIEDRGITKKVSEPDSKKLARIFGENLITYFPSYRYEAPGYLNRPYQVQLSFRKSENFSGTMPNPIEVVSGLPQIANWMMDVVLDIRAEEPRAKLMWERINMILTGTLASKKFGDVRFGVGPRGLGGARIQVVANATSQMIYPSVFLVSAGEAAMLCLFGEILRQGDNIIQHTAFDQITGIVAIDEIDKHLHIKLQKECLPKLLALFPKVQFVTSSHSPFFSMGLAEELPSRSKLIDLESSGLVIDPTSNELYREVYEMMIHENERFRSGYQELAAKAAEDAKPLVVTEGKTDVQHLRAAQRALGLDDIDVEYYEVTETLGDSKLKVMLEQLSRITQKRKIIGIFDRDVPKIVVEIESGASGFKDYGNDVFAFCLPVPSNREGYSNISIEFFYKDQDLKKEKNGKCIYFDNELRLETPLSDRSEKVLVRMESARSEDELSKKVYDENLGNHNWIHSKSRFADLVENDQEFASGIDFGEFQQIFDKIRVIVGA
jgi:hypothetical protein